ncbi:phospholipase-like protein, partial [Tanacetum coccineum]
LWSEVQKLEAENKRLAKQRRIMFHKMKEQENDMKSSYFSNSTHMKLALEKFLSIDTLKKQNNVLDQYMIEKCQQLKPWGEEDLTRPFNCIDKVYCNFVLEQFLIKSSWRHCKFPWCNDISVDGRFWDALIGLDDKRLGWLLDDVWHMWHFRQSCHDWSIVSCYFLTLLLQDSMSFFYVTDEIYPMAWRDVEQMRSCLETKLHVLLHRTGVFASKGIDPNNYSIKFSQEQNVPQQGGLFGDCGVFVCLFLYRLAHGIPLAVEDPIQMALAYREKMVKFYFEHKIICPS